MKSLILVSFVFVSFIQLFIPAKMILNREEVLADGVEYYFPTAPVDPDDPFRGKYIYLNYTTNSVIVDSAYADKFEWNQEVFAGLEKDDKGVVRIANIYKEVPQNDGIIYTKALVRTIEYDKQTGQKEIYVDFPFDRFYMEESKAYDAELIYNESSRDSTSVTYAVVMVLDGKAVLKDVQIDGVSIKDAVLSNRNK